MSPYISFCLLMPHHVSSCLILSPHVSSCLLMSPHVSLSTTPDRCVCFCRWLSLGIRKQGPYSTRQNVSPYVCVHPPVCTPLPRHVSRCLDRLLFCTGTRVCVRMPLCLFRRISLCLFGFFYSVASRADVNMIWQTIGESIATLSPRPSATISTAEVTAREGAPTEDTGWSDPFHAPPHNTRTCRSSCTPSPSA